MFMQIAREYRRVYQQLFANFTLAEDEERPHRVPVFTDDGDGIENHYIIVTYDEGDFEFENVWATSLVESSEKATEVRGRIILARELAREPVETRKLVLASEWLQVMRIFCDLQDQRLDEEKSHPRTQSLQKPVYDAIFEQMESSECAPRDAELATAIRLLMVPPELLAEAFDSFEEMPLSEIRKLVKNSRQAEVVERKIQQVSTSVSEGRGIDRRIVQARIHETLGMRGEEETPFRVLALDGGGIRGIYQARLLELIEEKILDGTPVVGHFDLLAGTSVGAIIAVGLSWGLGAEEMKELLEQFGTKVFCWVPKWLGLWNAAIRRKESQGVALMKRLAGFAGYSSARLRKILEKAFAGNPPFSTCNTRTLVFAVALNDLTIQVFDSDDDQYRSLGIVDVLLASTAAPTYFMPHLIEKLSTTFIDGGLACNNPALKAILESRVQCPDSKEMRILSIGNSNHQRSESPGKWKWVSPIKWAKKVIDICFETNSELVDTFCLDYFRAGAEAYLPICPSKIQSVELDDFNAIDDLLNAAKRSMDERGAELEEWFA